MYLVYHIDFGHDNSYVTSFYYKSIEKLPFTEVCYCNFKVNRCIAYSFNSDVLLALSFVSKCN